MAVTLVCHPRHLHRANGVMLMAVTIVCHPRHLHRSNSVMMIEVTMISLAALLLMWRLVDIQVAMVEATLALVWLVVTQDALLMMWRLVHIQVAMVEATLSLVRLVVTHDALLLLIVALVATMLISMTLAQFLLLLMNSSLAVLW